MNSQLPRKELEQFILDNMDRYKVYTLIEFYSLYESIMNRDGLIENYSVMSQESFRKLAGEWSKPGGKIVKFDKLKKPVYYKRSNHLNDMGFAEWRENADKIINNVKGIFKCRK